MRRADAASSAPSAPPAAARPWRRPRPAWRNLLSSPLRCLPDFLILGAQKAGTTSLFAHLNDHPAVWMPPCKECHFFSGPWRPLTMYRGFYPTASTRRRVERTLGRRLLLGEATPYDLFHPRSPGRVARALPRVKLIVILRDPVERAYSHYRHCVRRGTESLSFAAAIDAEPARTAGEAERLARTRFTVSDSHRHHTYVARGHYAEQLERWLEHVGRDRMHVAIFEHLFEAPGPALAGIEAFLGLPTRDTAAAPRRNAGSESQPMDAAIRRRLAETFAESNRRLERLLGIDLPWTTP